MSIAEAFDKQVGWCEALGSPFTAEVLRLLAEDLRAGGPAASIVGDWPGDPVADALPLRLAGALHALVLSASAPELAACYPPHHGSGTPERLRSALRTTLLDHAAYIRSFLASPPQTNEVGRSGVLLGGFLTVAKTTMLPLNLLEIGASAGLNLVWDRYRYTIGSGLCGPKDSPVVLAPAWRGGLPPLDASVTVAARAGCDVAPINLDDPAQRLRLRAYVWADQVERLARLDGAVELALRVGHKVERADAADWLDDRLSVPAPGRATVVYHSIMWQYMPQSSQARITGLIEGAGARATHSAPLAWLRFEPAGPDAKPRLRLRIWPGAEDRHLADAHPHGQSVTWLDDETERPSG